MCGFGALNVSGFLWWASVLVSSLKLKSMIFKKIRSSYVYVFLLFSVAFFSQCAQTQTPSGGPKDTIPPILLSVSPANYSTNFKAKEVVFVFNEYLQLKDVQKEVLISPPILPRPTMTLKGKGFVLKFTQDTELEPNTTYKIDFGSSIADNNEGNAAKRFEYIFSTGSHIDSLVMTGHLADAVTGAPVVNGFVMYFADSVVTSDPLAGDSTIFKGAKLSLARTDSTGNFIATNLKDANYRVFAILDDNGNQEYDMGTDKVGLSDEVYNPATMPDFDVWIDPIKDRIEVTPQLKLNMFTEKRAFDQALKEVTRPTEYMLQLVFATDSAKIVAVDVDSIVRENIIIENYRQKDSVRVWVRPMREDFTLPDTLRGQVVYYKPDTLGVNVLDTTAFELAYFKKKEKNTMADKVAAKFDSLFDKIGKWFTNFFMGKKKKRAIAIDARNKVVRDSLAKIQADSLLMAQAQDSIIQALKRDSIAAVEVAMGIINRDSLRKFKVSFNPSSTMSPEGKLYMKADLPMEIDTSLMEVVRMSYAEKNEDHFSMEEVSQVEDKPTIRTVERYRLERDTLDITRWLIDVNWQPKSEYNITLENDALLNLAGEVNDSLTQVIKTFDPVEYGRLQLSIKLQDPQAQNSYIVSLLDSTNNIVATKTITGEGLVEFNYLSPKKYKLKFVDDKNSNAKQDIGSVLKNIMPEAVEIYQYEKNKPLFAIEENKDFVMEIYPEFIFKPKTTEEELEGEVVEAVEQTELMDAATGEQVDAEDVEEEIGEIIEVVEKEENRR